MLDFRILGPLEVVDGDRQVALGKPQQRARGEALADLNRAAFTRRLPP